MHGPPPAWALLFGASARDDTALKTARKFSQNKPYWMVHFPHAIGDLRSGDSVQKSIFVQLACQHWPAFHKQVQNPPNLPSASDHYSGCQSTRCMTTAPTDHLRGFWITVGQRPWHRSESHQASTGPTPTTRLIYLFTFSSSLQLQFWQPACQQQIVRLLHPDSPRMAANAMPFLKVYKKRNYARISRSRWFGGKYLPDELKLQLMINTWIISSTALLAKLYKIGNGMIILR
ncbi:hypothetical protein T11_11336 [Trichinella zimbabwensis]|uniref:Uncharacterized protein n=1 Tax=Trichinella zimbabwensis TaxID=268475 RepID=A0A0V1HFY7_9BILA|nr:hypothetical protein T11_11336 [Trichinella zimbabwensis]